MPGTVLAGRYRLVALLGKGGMGEVYRADDLKLDQTVALKFLPETFARNGPMLGRFHREVSIARRVSHPHVCRVYDIGDIDGRHFISMEYIDGEDLASLLRRIGRLPPDKALEIARQLCAGLGAAHDKRVLHHDLKPANIMIDGRGEVRITDFGLARFAEGFREEEGVAGTPAYMSPEQLAGNEGTVRSDIYALGLVLYEVFTGRRAFEASTIAGLARLREQTVPPSPSSHVSEIDPLVERAILRCLEREPNNRPASALQVAAALPGGDPLRAALAAGLTPSPEIVAAASTESSLRPAVAAACLAAVLAGLIAIAVVSGHVSLFGLVPLEKSPEALQEHAREIFQKLGYRDPATDTAYGFSIDDGYVQYLVEHDQSSTRWNPLATGQPAALYFWYRQSPRYLEALGGGDVSIGDPPFDISGMASVLLDTRGRLITLRVVPSERVPLSGPEDAEWAALFAEAGLDLARFTPTESQRIPLVYGDIRRAWDGAYGNQAQIPIHVEAAAYRGRPVHFEILAPWSRPPGVESDEVSPRLRVLYVLLIVVAIAAALAGVWLTRRNLRLGRGDRKGAFRLALYAFTTTMLGWVVSAHHVPTVIGEFILLNKKLGGALLGAAVLWLLYIALEPYVRRRWPHRIISWTRLLAGDVRNPLVGRDLLIGVLIGVVRCLQLDLRAMVWQGLGWPSVPLLGPAAYWLDALRDTGGLANQMIGNQGVMIISVLVTLFLLVLSSILLKKDWLAVGALWVFGAVATDLVTSNSTMNSFYGAMDLLNGAVNAGLFIFLLMRFGLLASVVGHIFFLFFRYLPITADLSHWYAGGSTSILLAAAAVAAYGFWKSLAGQSVFQGRLLED